MVKKWCHKMIIKVPMKMKYLSHHLDRLVEPDKIEDTPMIQTHIHFNIQIWDSQCNQISWRNPWWNGQWVGINPHHVVQHDVNRIIHKLNTHYPHQQYHGIWHRTWTVFSPRTHMTTLMITHSLLSYCLDILEPMHKVIYLHKLICNLINSSKECMCLFAFKHV